MRIPKRAQLRLPVSVRQGLTLLTGSTVAQIVPAILAPVLTRLYVPADFGTFAFVLAVFGVLAPLVCMRYELAIMLPEDDERAAHVTLLCFIIALTIAVLAFLAPLGLWVFASGAGIRTFAPLLLAMLPAGIAMLGIQLVAQNWTLRTHNYRVLSLSIVVQAIVTIGVQTLLGATLGSSPYFLIIGTLAGYLALVLVYLPEIRGQILPRLKKHHSFEGALRAARLYLRFPIYTGPYAFVCQASVRGVFVVLAALTSAAVVGQYALAQRVIFLPVSTLMAAASQVFFSRAARKLDDPRMPKMVRTLLIAGPLAVGPFFMLIFLFGEPIFATVFGRAWQQAGRFAVILAFPSMVKSLTAWLDRVYDIRSRQRLALINEIAYSIVALAGAYIVLLVSGDAELAVETYAAVTVIYYVLWLLCSLWVAGFDLLIGREFVLTSAAMSCFLIGSDRVFRWMGAETPIRAIADALMAMPVVAAGLWFAARRMSVLSRSA
ncbi:MAG: lipopolysaccharide biosynthesis protein [Steroidobacteraceae bacterium]